MGLQRVHGNRYVQRACAACREGRGACPACEQEPRRVGGVIQRAEFDVLGIPGGAANLPGRIFFDKDRATVEGAELGKVAALAKTETPLTLHGFQSEEEQPGTAKARIAAVDKALASAGHKAVRTPVERAGAGVGNIRYRFMRVVDVIAPEAVSGVLDCETVGEVVACGNPPNPFTEAVTEATAQLGRAATALGKQPLPEPFTRLFGNSEETAATMRANLLLLSEHLTNARRPERHVCHNECDAQCTSATAYNTGRGDEARMTLCTPFMTDSLGQRAWALIHEGSHGALKTADRAYATERYIEFLTPAEALSNADSYSLLISRLEGASSDAPPTDVVPPEVFEAEREPVREALALTEVSLTSADQVLQGVYATIRSSRARGEWDNPFYAGAMAIVRRVLPDAFPSEGIPSEVEQFRIAGMRDRFFQVRLALIGPQTVRMDRENATTWTGDVLTLGPDFFKQQLDRRVQLLLLTLLKQSGLEPRRAVRYVALATTFQAIRSGKGRD